jgi:ankyrin repeat protein
LTIDEGDYHGRTALHLAAANGHMHIVNWLAGTMRADVTVVDIIGMTPLMEAVKNKHHEIARYLRSRRATLGHDDKGGTGPHQQTATTWMDVDDVPSVTAIVSHT